MTNRFVMSVLLGVGVLSLAACTTPQERIGGAGTGAVAGAAVAGPPGALVGGVAGVITGPTVSRSVGLHRHGHYYHHRRRVHHT
ncbi:hypothetical protein [Methylovirgula sp. 4M-Z18]|uniref:hypothetical protein n=1 Tax=Methylovirgula sp. 4M-Z18 TaxID=2293567 RepID=UPI000E2ECE99|nr:hypothetical protein [Methylovirgula sp. 4M-Z18]RFB79710.1 hypothetical protein DYH55_09545 [Methylovirgula sp. 4M-Z18]